ncbi:MAG: NADH-quinone oxidoreductase subunit N [Planctomycetota bacterium]|nr:NADH-quinone oxidoreductase subunit N [Planctomycetota bacterium]
MTFQSTQDAFDAAFSTAALPAVLPAVILSVGALLMLLIEIVPGARASRPIVVLATLVGALFANFTQLSDPAGPVLDGIYASTPETAIWGMLFAAGALLAWVYSIGYYGEKARPFLAEHDMLFLSAPAGMTLMVCSQDLLMFFVGLELLSLPLYARAAFRRERHDSVEAGLKYFLLGAFAAATYLFGASLLYLATGTISVMELKMMMGDTITTTPVFLAGAGLLVAGIFFKISVFPFHMWVPDVYEGSPTPVTTLMATGTKAAAFGFLIPISFLLPTEATGLIAAIALLTMAAGNLGALVQTNIKRMLAYSGVAHAGTILLVIAGYLASGRDDAIGEQALHAALFYLAAYLFTSTGSFGLLAMLERDGEDLTTMRGIRGLARRRPAVAAAMTLFMLSLGGIPATGGFFGKWFVFTVLVQEGMYGVAILGALMSVVALGYYLRVIVNLWMEPLDEADTGRVAPVTLPAGIATAVCALGVLVLGLMPGWFLDLLG